MRVLVLGSGGREHAVAWKLAQSPLVDEVRVAPGNGGTAGNAALDPMEFDGVRRFCESERIDVIFVGPEGPLVGGIADYFQGSPVAVFGPGRDGARLEGSKILAKRFMQRHGVATAPFWAFEAGEDPGPLIRELDGDLVVKFDGLAAGKGVHVCSSVEDATRAVAEIRGSFGRDASFLIERRLGGMEVSIIGITDGTTIRMLQPSQDHKQIYDGDLGPNTGGMGAYAPVPFCTPDVLARVDRDIVAPTLAGLRAEGIAYHGALYFGIMLAPSGPHLLEYNVRLGDPEAEVTLAPLATDFAELVMACVRGTLSQVELTFHPGSFVDVVMASRGYPGPYASGFVVDGLDGLPSGAMVFHAGTRRVGSGIVTSGGRVLNVVGSGPTLEEAIECAYRFAEGIRFENRYFRRDIGRKGLA
jgi:phosphoribosylamine--glycine ligase